MVAADVDVEVEQEQHGATDQTGSRNRPGLTEPGTRA
jgi:hypothetical protein